MRSLRSASWLGLALITLALVTPGAFGQGQNASGELLVKDSVWSGPCMNLIPKADFNVAITVTERNGENFTADLRINGKHQRNIAGTVNGEKIEWRGAPGDPKPGHYNVGTIHGKRMDLKYYKTKGDTEVVGQFYLELQSGK